MAEFLSWSNEHQGRREGGRERWGEKGKEREREKEGGVSCQGRSSEDKF